MNLTSKKDKLFPLYQQEKANNYDKITAIICVVFVEIFEVANVLIYKENTLIYESYSQLNNFIFFKSLCTVIITYVYMRVNKISLEIHRNNMQLIIVLIKSISNYFSVFFLLIILSSTSTFVCLSLTLASSITLIATKSLDELLTARKISLKFLAFLVLCFCGVGFLLQNNEAQEEIIRENQWRVLETGQLVVLLFVFYLCSSFGVWLQGKIVLRLNSGMEWQLIITNTIIFTLSFFSSLCYGVLRLDLDLIFYVILSSSFTFIIIYLTKARILNVFNMKKILIFVVIRLVFVVVLAYNFFGEKTNLYQTLGAGLEVSYFYFDYFINK